MKIRKLGRSGVPAVLGRVLGFHRQTLFMADESAESMVGGTTFRRLKIQTSDSRVLVLKPLCKPTVLKPPAEEGCR